MHIWELNIHAKFRFNKKLFIKFNIYKLTMVVNCANQYYAIRNITKKKRRFDSAPQITSIVINASLTYANLGACWQESMHLLYGDKLSLFAQPFYLHNESLHKD